MQAGTLPAAMSPAGKWACVKYINIREHACETHDNACKMREILVKHMNIRVKYVKIRVFPGKGLGPGFSLCCPFGGLGVPERV